MDFAEIISLNEDNIEFKIINDDKNNIKSNLDFKNIKWTIPKKLIKDIHKVGDIIFVKKEKNFGLSSNILKLMEV